MYPTVQGWKNKYTHYESIALSVLKQAKQAGATQAELSFGENIGFSINVHKKSVETLEYHQDKELNLTVYFGNRRGEASTTDLSSTAIQDMVMATCRIARLTQPDEAAGLADPKYLACDYPNLDLYHPWVLSPSDAIDYAIECETHALELDSRVLHAEDVGIDTKEAITLYANTHDFIGYYLNSLHSIYCTLVAQDLRGGMQRDGSYKLSRDAATLPTMRQLATESVEMVTRRLGASRIPTCKVPVIFEARVAKKLIGYFLSAISGKSLYQNASFLLNQLGQPIFPAHVNIEDLPYQAKGLGSAPFDAEGVKPHARYLVREGILEGYLLSTYSARRLGLETTGNAGGAYNIAVKTHVPNLNALIAKMDRGLLVTEVIGSGVNIVTGDYSQGVVGFWVENGKIQYPVEEITAAGNLREMYQNLVAIAGDIDINGNIQTGSILIEQMMIAGK
jgi:PmbA protein